MGPYVVVRKVTVSDAAGIARVWVESWKRAYATVLPPDFLDSAEYDTHEAGIRRHLRRSRRASAVFVAVEEAAQVLGVALVRAIQSDPKGFTAELDGIYVLPARQHEGVGRRLVLQVARWSQAHNHRAWLGVRST